MTPSEHHPEDLVHGFDGLTRVVAQPVAFKARLGVGERAFASLRVGRNLGELWQLAAGAAAGGAIANSSVVATAFFGTSSSTLLGSTLSILGFGTAAATPMGWVVGAAAAVGGVNWGVQRLWRTYTGSRVDGVPRFINTPIDVLGASILDLMGGLSVLVALQSGALDADERDAIRDYFVEEWGFDADYVATALPLIEAGVRTSSIDDVARILADFAKSSPDCSQQAIGDALCAFLTEVAEADGCMDEAEQAAITRISAVFADATRSGLARALGGTMAAVATRAGATSDGVGASVGAARMRIGALAATTTSRVTAFSAGMTDRLERARERWTRLSVSAKRTVRGRRERLLPMAIRAHETKDRPDSVAPQPGQHDTRP